MMGQGGPGRGAGSMVQRLCVLFCALLASGLSTTPTGLPASAHTAPLPGSAGNASALTSIAFGSCNHQDMDQSVWDRIREASSPDLYLWIGDNIYGDHLEYKPLPPSVFHAHGFPSRIRESYTRLAMDPHYRSFVGEVPVLAVWDDHDYGVNDGDRTFAHRAESQRLFLDFFGAPASDPRRRRPGVYSSALLGPPGKRVGVILLDNRYFKDPYSVGPNGDMLGLEQWAWFEAEVARMSAAAQVLLVGAGLQMLPDDRAVGEFWGKFPRARQRLIDVVGRFSGPALLLSGDVHYAELTEVRCGRRHLVEATSSGLTHSWGEPNGFLGKGLFDRVPGLSAFCNGIGTVGFRLMQVAYPSPYRKSNFGDVSARRNFGVIELDWSGARPRLNVSIRSVDGSIVISRDVSYSNVGEGGACAPVGRPMGAARRALGHALVIACTIALVALLAGAVTLSLRALREGSAVKVLLCVCKVYLSLLRGAPAPLRPRGEGREKDKGE